MKTEVFGLWAAGSLIKSGGYLFDYKNPIDVYVPEHVEFAGEALVPTKAEAESETQHL